MRVGLNDRLDAGGGGRVLAMQTELTQLVAAGPADVERPAAREQPPGKSLEPIQAAIEGPRRRRCPSVSQKTQAVGADESPVDVHAAIEQDAIAQAAAGVGQQ